MEDVETEHIDSYQSVSVDNNFIIFLHDFSQKMNQFAGRGCIKIAEQFQRQRLFVDLFCTDAKVSGHILSSFNGDRICLYLNTAKGIPEVGLLYH